MTVVSWKLKKSVVVLVVSWCFDGKLFVNDVKFSKYFPFNKTGVSKMFFFEEGFPKNG